MLFRQGDEVLVRGLHGAAVGKWLVIARVVLPEAPTGVMGRVGWRGPWHVRAVIVNEEEARAEAAGYALSFNADRGIPRGGWTEFDVVRFEDAFPKG